MSAEAPGAPRPRPRLHFTASDGWVNDPYGLTWTGDRYHLFYQALPGRVTWAPDCQWGHAESPDLVHWSEQPLALVPQSFEVGCWSGSFIVDQGGRGTILYTRIAGDDWGQGKVALARGDRSFRQWVTTADDVVIDGPPPGLGVHSFRDPYVFRYEGGWTMVMAAGLADGSGAALQYRSADLRHWSYDGVLCSRLSSAEDQVWTGALWECPQLFPLGGDWVLLVSVWDADELHYVAGAIGDYDGRKFSPRSWQRLTYGPSAYAMSSFVDKEDKRCVISWLREEPRNNPSLVQRAGAHSVASLLVREEDGLLGLRPHTDVLALAGPASPFPVEGSSELCRHGGPVLVTLSPATADQLALGAPGAVRAEIRVERGRHRVQVVRPGFGDLEMPLSEGANGHDVDVLVDSDLVEVFARGSYGAFRLLPSRDGGVTEFQLSGMMPEQAVVRLFPGV